MGDDLLKIDIGCGNNKQEGYVGVDIDKNGQADVIASALNLPFGNESVDEIVCRHVIEHFNPEEAEKVFDEFYRVLKKGGQARLKIDRDLSRKWLLKKDPTHKYRYNVSEINNLSRKFSFAKIEKKIYFSDFKLRNKIVAELLK